MFMSPLLVVLVCGLGIVVALVLYAIYVRLGEIHELLAGLAQQSAVPAPPAAPARTVVPDLQAAGAEPPEVLSLRLSNTFMQPQAKQPKASNVQTILAGLLLVAFLILLAVIISLR